MTDPVAIDINGVIRLSNALAIIEERLSNLIDDCAKASDAGYPNLAILHHMNWTVTMWHFGADALLAYSGEMFFARCAVGQNALITAYSNDIKNGKTRIRLERQEYPKKSLAETLGEKLDAIGVRAIVSAASDPKDDIFIPLLNSGIKKENDLLQVRKIWTCCQRLYRDRSNNTVSWRARKWENIALLYSMCNVILPNHTNCSYLGVEMWRPSGEKLPNRCSAFDIAESVTAPSLL